MRVFSHWIVTDDYVRTDPLEKLKVPKIPHTVVETFPTDQMSDLLVAAPAPLAITLRIFLDTGVRLNEATGLRILGRRRRAAPRAPARAATSGPSPLAGPSTPPSAAT